MNRMKEVLTSFGLSGILGNEHPWFSKQYFFSLSTQTMFPFPDQKGLQNTHALSSKDMGLAADTAALPVESALTMAGLAVTPTVAK